MNILKSHIKAEAAEEPKAKKPKKKAKSSESNMKKSKSSEGFFSSVKNFILNEKFHKVVGIIFILFSVFLLLSFISYFFTWKQDQSIIDNISTWFAEKREARKHLLNIMGLLGAYLSDSFIKHSFGITAFFFVLLFFIIGIKLFLKRSLLPISKTFMYSFIGIIWISVLSGYIANIVNNSEFTNYAGALGFEINLWIEQIIGKLGTLLILVSTLIIFLIITYNFSWKFKTKEVAAVPADVDDDGFTTFNTTEQDEPVSVSGNKMIAKEESELQIEEEVESVPEKEEEIIDEEDDSFIDDIDSSEVELIIEKKEEEVPEIEDNENKEYVHKYLESLYDPRLDLSDYKFPAVDLLDDYGSEEVNVQKDELEANKNRIVGTLKNYGIIIEKIKATIGPTVTLYELVPAAGVRISKIKGLEDDIAMSLSALGIRIIAPMPGKGTIGIEVPNKNPEIVSMKSILSSDKFQNSKFELPIALGKTISNEAFIVNLTKLPHILMAGATGQGKSVGLNTILTSLLYKKHPSEIKFVLIDPKKVELTLYEKIERHFLAKLPDSEEAIITDTRKVVRTLNSLCIEMDNRFNLLKDAQVRNIQEYNEKFKARKLNPNNGHRFMPYIILVVDEFADLIMTAGKEVETPLTRLAQLARAIGIHLIIATQRPTVNIITGTIKANFPCRIAFRVVSKIDSRTVLDTNGADQLIGRGDMLLATGSDVLRLQCAFIDIHELERLTSFIGDQRAYPDAYNLPEYYDKDDEQSIVDVDPSDRDEFFEEAARIIVQSQHGSTSLIQRKLKLGYNRAGRIIDQLEAAGIIGSFEGSKAREVRIKDEVGLEQLLQRLRSND